MAGFMKERGNTIPIYLGETETLSLSSADEGENKRNSCEQFSTSLPLMMHVLPKTQREAQHLPGHELHITILHMQGVL